jgi:hypothetical protein
VTIADFGGAQEHGVKFSSGDAGRAVHALTVQAKRTASPFAFQAKLSASSTACTKSSGASCGRLWPMPPVSVRCTYLPVNRPA